MQVSVENFGTLGRRLTIAVPAERVEKEFATRLQRLTKQVKMPGFRPGKVPLKMVEAQYGGRLMDEVTGELIQTTLREAIGSHGLRPAGDPRIERKPVARGEQLEYTVEFEVIPELKRFDLAGLSLERPVASVTDEDVARTLETIRQQRARWQSVDRAARTGDRLIIDFVGRIDGKEFEGGKASGFQLTLGSGALIPEIEQGLEGATRGETRTIGATFPSDYRHAPLAGQRADFEIQVNQVIEPVLPELNEEFARELGVPDGDLEKLRADVRANLERESAGRTRTIVRLRVLKLLLEANPIEIPQGLLEVEIQRLKATERTEQPGRAQPTDAERRDRAARRVALRLVLGEFIRHRGISPDAARVRAKLEELAADYESPEEFMRWHYEKPERLTEIHGLVVEEQVAEDLLRSVATVDRPVSFQELLQIDVVI